MDPSVRYLAIEWLTMLAIVQTDVGLNAGDCVLLLAEIHREYNAFPRARVVLMLLLRVRNP
jgi:hypothetical protein